jgi:hypothetical protein
MYYPLPLSPLTPDTSAALHLLRRDRAWATDIDLRAALIGACIFGLRHSTATDHRSQIMPLSSWVARESLKMPLREIEAVCTAMEQGAALLAAPHSRLEIGRVLRAAKDVRWQCDHSERCR